MKTPDVSVVMSVYNGENHLAATVDSILAQEGVSLEFIIVDDGSTDRSPEILKEYAGRDNRIRIISQENRGLTKALIKGCAASTAAYIARQDVGDASLPGRLRSQFDFIRRNNAIAFVSCGTRMLGPANEYLYEITQSTEEATSRLRTLDIREIRGPSMHGSVMFSRETYEKVGGYRSDFYFAQDLDLWIRMAELGEHAVLPEVLCEAAITPEAISGLYRNKQIETARLILESARLRRCEMDDSEILKQAQAIRPETTARRSGVQRAKSLYFIGMAVRRHNPRQARKYFKAALSEYPLHVKSAIRLLGV